MANTREEQAVVNTEPTPLDPSPKRVEGVADTVDHVADLGDTYGTLHKPALKIEKKDGVREQRAITNKAPEESPERHGVISAKKVILPNANSLVDGNGNPLISGGGSSGDSPRVFELSYDFNEIPSEIISQLRVGDVVKSKAVVIGTVTYKDETDVTIVSIDASCVTYYYYNFADEEWVYSNMHSYDLSEMGSKLYHHSIQVISATDQKDFVINLLSTDSSKVTDFSTLYDFLFNYIGEELTNLYGAYGVDTSTGSMISELCLRVITDVPTICFNGENTGQYDYNAESNLTITDNVFEVL